MFQDSRGSYLLMVNAVKHDTKEEGRAPGFRAPPPNTKTKQADHAGKSKLRQT